MLSTASREVPQAAGRNPAAGGASPPEGRAHQAAGVGDQQHEKLSAELTLTLFPFYFILFFKDKHGLSVVA